MMETEEKYKVVIVDDERTAIDALRRELEPYREFEVKGIAGNGAKGKKMIMELHPDLLFLDVELPDTLGLNLLSEIREDILWDMKVVFYTSYDKYLLQALRESACTISTFCNSSSDTSGTLISISIGSPSDSKLLAVFPFSFSFI